MIQRSLQKTIASRLFDGKAILIFGPRQVGKTTLLKLLTQGNDKVLWLNGDEPDVKELFAHLTSTRLKPYLGKANLLIVDEAQRIADIGLKLKIIIDALKDVQLIATGSSSFELANKVNEPLTGRKFEYKLLPFSFGEMVNEQGLLKEKRMLAHRMIYGYYPEIVNHPGDEKERLQLLTESYLYKDILVWEQIHKPDKLTKLLQALAYQVGAQVSYNELGQICGLDAKTVEKYILVLEQAFIIFRLKSFKRNLRNELKISKKIYFYDNGIRNAIIANFDQIETRKDIGALWENFLMAERQKYISYHMLWVKPWFWKTKDQQEIDYLEEADGKLAAYAFKWNPKAKYKFPRSFKETYVDSSYKLIHKENVEDFLLD